jgi:hypothetical protein
MVMRTNKLTFAKASCYDDRLPMIVKQKIWIRLRIAIAALTLALGWISVPLSLAALEPDVCEVECCIAEGHCCCAARRPYVKGHEPKPGDVSITIETALTDPCPDGCATSRISAKDKLLRAAQAQATLVTLAFIPPENYRSPVLLDSQFAAQPSSPRAPPTCDGHIA